MMALEVLNSKKIRADCLIGAFKFDLGTVYDAPGKTSYCQNIRNREF